MTAKTGAQKPSRARRRVQARVRHTALWTDAELSGLDRLYRHHPKWWWHVQRVVRQQVQVGLLACELELAPLISSPLLDELAFDAEPDALAKALKVALRTVRGSGSQRAWTSLESVLVAMLRREDPPAQELVEPIPIDLGDDFTPLNSWPALRAEGREMASCVGQLSWWRETVYRQGMGYALRREGTRATVWLGIDLDSDSDSDSISTALGLRSALGPRNRPLDDDQQAWIDDHVAAVLRTTREDEASAAELDGWLTSATARPPSDFKRSEAIEQLANRLSHTRLMIPPRVWRKTMGGALKVEGLWPAHWLRSYMVFASPPVWTGSPYAQTLDPPPESTLWWDDAQEALVAKTREGVWTLRSGLPLRLDGPADADPSTPPPFLWMDACMEPAEPELYELPEDVHHARCRWLATLPDWLTRACAELEPMRGMPGIWLLSQAPELVPLLRRFPALAAAVQETACARPGTLASLKVCLDAPEPHARLLAVLSWLGLPHTERIAEQIDRLQDEYWSLDAFVALSWVLIGGTEARALLDRLHRIHPIHAIIVYTALQTALVSSLSPSLLMDAMPARTSAHMADQLGAIFAELEASVQRTGRKIPKLRSLAHLARVLAQRHQPAASGLEVLELEGPWDQPARSLDEVERLAVDLGCMAEDWRAAATTGMFVFAGVPLGIPTVSWLRPAGLRGQLRLAATHTATGREAPAAVRTLLAAQLTEQNRRVAKLQPGWSAEDAEAAGLPACLATVSGAGRHGLASSIRMLLTMRG